MRHLILITFLLATACGDGINPPTMGDAVEEIGTAFCEARTACGLQTPNYLESCIEHNVFHLCTIKGTCDVELTSEQIDMLDPCVSGFGDFSCTELLFGLVPDECIPFL